MAIARKDLGIRIRPSDVSWSEREDGGGSKAPILVKYVHFINFTDFYLCLSRFNNTHSLSVCYDLMDRSLRGKMGRAGVYWDRFQAETDHKLFQVGLKLKRAKVIHEVVVDRHHVTNVVVRKGD